MSSKQNPHNNDMIILTSKKTHRVLKVWRLPSINSADSYENRYDAYNKAFDQHEKKLKHSCPDNAEEIHVALYQTEDNSGKNLEPVEMKDRWLFNASCWQSSIGHTADNLLLLKIHQLFDEIKGNAGKHYIEITEGEETIQIAVDDKICDVYNGYIEQLRMGE